MGERKGVNKYYPPDYNPDKGSLNKYHGTHALRERARKLHMGILIIRFEMPYNIWCDGCGNHIGTGVRYNAEKKKIGMYYTTPVFQFRMKCHLCDNHFEIKTDPANLDYVIVSGARRQERRWDPKQNEQITPEDRAASQKLATDPMFKLEHGTDDVDKSKKQASTLARLTDHRERWYDDFMANKLLRDQFRREKRELQTKAQVDSTLKSKSSLSIPLLPESADDVKLAALLRLHPNKSYEDREKEIRAEIIGRPLFSSPTEYSSTNKTLTNLRNSVMVKRSAGKLAHLQPVGVSPSKVKRSLGKFSDSDSNRKVWKPSTDAKDCSCGDLQTMRGSAGDDKPVCERAKEGVETDHSQREELIDAEFINGKHEWTGSHINVDSGNGKSEIEPNQDAVMEGRTNEENKIDTGNTRSVKTLVSLDYDSSGSETA